MGNVERAGKLSVLPDILDLMDQESLNSIQCLPGSSMAIVEVGQVEPDNAIEQSISVSVEVRLA